MANKPFITTSHGMSGHFAVLMTWVKYDDPLYKDEGQYEPWNTGIGRYKTKAEAEVEARQWAEAEELEYQP